MEDVRVGLVIRAVRRRRGWRQRDLALAAGVCQVTISRIETGRLDQMTLHSIRAVAAALQLNVRMEARWRGPELAVLLDERHSALVDRVVGQLRGYGWECVVEHTFSLGRETGSVDVLGWHASSRTLLVVEAKTALPDIQEMLSTLDRKTRLARTMVAGRFGWRPANEATVLVVAASPSVRGAVARRKAIFEAAFPARTVEVRQWAALPNRPLRGLWFVSEMHRGNGMKRLGGSHRVRRLREAKAGPVPRSSERAGKGTSSETAGRTPRIVR